MKFVAIAALLATVSSIRITGGPAPAAAVPIPTPPGPSIPLHNPNKAGNGDTVTATLAQNPAWNCKCMGTTCWDHEGASCNTHQQPAHGGEKCQGGSRTSCSLA